MLYGIIMHRGSGKYSFMMRPLTKFKNAEEERLLSPHIAAILEEETGDGFLLAEKIAAYVRKHNLSMETPIDLTGVARSACLSQDERTEMLQTSVRVLAKKLEDAERKIWELEYAHWCAHSYSVSASHELGQIEEILRIAREDLECEHIYEATMKYEQWKADHLQ